MQKSRRQAGYNYIKQVSDSQNFLTSRKLIQRIVRLAGFQRKDMVLEIGTGKGHLTEALCQKAGKVCLHSVALSVPMLSGAQIKERKQLTNSAGIIK